MAPHRHFINVQQPRDVLRRLPARHRHPLVLDLKDSRSSETDAMPMTGYDEGVARINRAHGPWWHKRLFYSVAAVTASITAALLWSLR
jgi:hypothetical protein